jgi:hypothetical protein
MTDDHDILTDLRTLIQNAETSADLDRAAKLLWRGHAEGLISDRAASGVDYAIGQRRGMSWELPGGYHPDEDRRPHPMGRSSTLRA